MALTSKERAHLRAEAHHLTAVAHVGAQGLTESVLSSIDDALRTRELIKVQLVKGLHQTAREAADEAAEQLGAEVVQVIGKTVSLYRENPDLERKKGAPPPWKQ